MHKPTRNHAPERADRTDGVDWALYFDPARKLAVPGPVGMAPVPGAIIIPRFRRACRSVVERAAKRLNAAARYA